MKDKRLLSYISFWHLKYHLTSAFLLSDDIQSAPREAFPISYDRWKNIEVHCNNDQSIRHSPLSKQDNAELPELAFNRLQQTDDGYAGLQRRNFGRFIAREAVLDEEYWVCCCFWRIILWLSFVTLSKYISDFLVPLSCCQWQTAAWLRAEAHWESVSYMRLELARITYPSSY